MLANPCIYVLDVATRAIARTDRLTPDDIGLLPVGKTQPRRSTASSTPPTNAGPSL